MWNNSQWEQENQELLKEWYLDKDKNIRSKRGTI